jgi:hypothetical protein
MSNSSVAGATGLHYKHRGNSAIILYKVQFKNAITINDLLKRFNLKTLLVAVGLDKRGPPFRARHFLLPCMFPPSLATTQLNYTVERQI